MQTIFRNGLATGKYAMGSNEALGSPSDFANSSIKAEPYDEDMEAKSMDVAAAKISAEAGKDTKEESTGASKKRKRSVFSEEDHMVMAGLTEAVKDVASAIRETKVEVLNPDLYGAVMYMVGVQ
jgi:transketolase C-terminal domain/subunit